MLRLLLICLSGLCVCLSLATEECTITGEDGTTYRKEVLAEDMCDPRKLVVEWKTDTLYLNHCNGGKRVSAAILLDQKQDITIRDFNMWCSHTVRQDRGGVYVGCVNQTGHGGLYHWDSNIGRFSPIGLEGVDIEFVHFNGELYYSIMPSWKLQAWSRGVSRDVPRLADTTVKEMVIDTNGDWVFRNDTAVCRLKSKTEEIKCTNGGATALATGPRGTTFVCEEQYDYLHQIEADGTQTRILHLPKCGGLAIDANNNFIYVQKGKVIRLIKC